MSENLDLVRSIYADWERGDFSHSDWADRNIQFEVADGPQPGRWVGREAMAREYGEMMRGFKEFRAEPERYVAADEHRILVLVVNTGRGNASGIEFEVHSVANFFEIRCGKVTRLVLYWDRDRALADLGLEE
jgi:ketosteroid isomerase-like protein